jgi:hypothetical protein
MFNFDAQQALGFLVSQTAHIEAQVAEVQYPDIQYPALIPVDTSANEWAKSVTYYSTNKVGQAGWFHHYAKDIHVADSERSKFEVGIEMADIGYRYTLEELGQAMMIPGMNLSGDRAMAAGRAYEEFVDNIAMNGDTEKSLSGLLDYPGITVVNAPADGDSSQADWEHKSADLILRDINLLLAGMWTNSKTIEMADTLLLPLAAMALLVSKRIADTNITVLAFVLANNIYTHQTGRPLTIRAVRGLENVGTGGAGRAIAYRRDPQVIKLHIPMTHRFLPVWQTGPLVYDVPGIFRLGGLEIRRPGAVRYLDGIMDHVS